MQAFRRRGIAGRIGTVVAAIAAIVLPGAGVATAASSSHAAPSATSTSGHTTCVAAGAGSQCTGTFSGDNAYDPWLDTYDNDAGAKAGSVPGGEISHPPVVTVSQTKDLVDQSVNVSWQYITPTLSQNTQPNGVNPLYYTVDIYECKGTNPTPDTTGLGDQCDEQLVGQPNVTTQTGAPNAVVASTYALGEPATGLQSEPNSKSWSSLAGTTGGDPAQWKGQAQIHLEVGQENSTLGCGPSAPCSLVILPNLGGNYANANDHLNTSQCGHHEFDGTGAGFLGLKAKVLPNDFPSPCQMNDRIVVPLSFSPLAVGSGCPDRNPQFSVFGSPMMSRAMTQWEGGMCTGPAPVSLQYSSLDEPDAREEFLQSAGALSSSVDMSLVTLPATGQTSSRKFTYAPLANSGVAMAYYLEDGSSTVGRPVGRVVLDPRLAAKLTTESYSLNYDCTVPPPPLSDGPKQWPPLPGPSQTCDPAVKGNPHTIFDDPEFQALNTGCQPLFEAATFSCGAGDFTAADNFGGNDVKFHGDFMPTVLGVPSDLTFQLTDWVGADAETAGFLAGKKDLWGMSVNTNYKNTSYPADQFQTLLDPGTQDPNPLSCKVSDNSCEAAGTFDATMQAAWNPDSDLGTITNNLLNLKPNANSPNLQCMVPQPSQCTSVSEWGFKPDSSQAPTARALFSELDLGDVAADLFPAASMVNGAGDAVAPSQTSVEAAVKDMKTNPDGITQFANESSTDPAAYPLAMVDYAMVPTCGLPASKASAIANFLDKAATSGQTQGVTPGTLAQGYYPLTSAQRAQTLKAAQEVKSQDCKSAPPDNTVSGHSGINDMGSPHNGSGAPGSLTGTPGGGKPGGKAPGNVGAASGQTPSSATGKLQPAAYGQKGADSGLTGILLLIALIVGGLALVGGPTAWVLTATGKWPVVLRWLRPVLTRLAIARTWVTGLLPTGKA